MTEHKHAAVLRAIADGREVQWQDSESDTWYGVDDINRINPLIFPDNKWRIKPRTPRRIWVNEYADGLSDEVFNSREEAERHRADHCVACMEFVEVLDE